MPARRASQRYPRPFLEIEFDQPALTQGGCCRYVPIVLRLCAVPEQVMLTVRFERVRKKDQQGAYLDDYEIEPYAYILRIPSNIPGYNEYATELLARPHATETGTIHIKLESHSSNLLSEALYRFDSRKAEPVRARLHPGSFRGERLIPFLRTTQARDALHGQYPAFVPGAHGPSSPPIAPTAASSTATSSTLRNWWLTKH